jgi:adenylate kinase family enzyme
MGFYRLGVYMKIQIIGFSGAGKSTLCKQFGKFYNLPVLHMDSLNFLSNWVERDRLEFNNIVDEFLDTNDSWVIDGNYFRISPKRYQQADLVLFLKYNRLTCIKGVIKRYKTYKNSSRPDMASGCKERLNFSFLMWVLFKGRTKKRRKHMLEVVNNAKSAKVFKNRKELNKYLKELGVI